MESHADHLDARGSSSEALASPRGSLQPGGVLLITGAPRSGTKLLRHLLNQHTRIDLTTNESEFLPWVLDFCEQGGLERPGGFERLVEYLKLENYFAHRRLEGFASADFESWRDRLSGATAADVFQVFLESEVAPARAGAYLGDKSPGFVRHLQRLMVELGSARVIHIVRDPRAQCGSLARAFGKSPCSSAIAWREAMDEVARTAERFPERVAEVRYEDLTSRPEESLRQLCDFLQIPYESGMASMEAEVEDLLRPGLHSIGIRAPRLYGYRDDLKAEEIAQVESICVEGMRRWGYALESGASEASLPRSTRAGVSRWFGQFRLAVIIARRYGWRHLLRRLRLVRARHAIARGVW